MQAVARAACGLVQQARRVPLKLSHGGAHGSLAVIEGLFQLERLLFGEVGALARDHSEQHDLGEIRSAAPRNLLNLGRESCERTGEKRRRVGRGGMCV